MKIKYSDVPSVSRRSKGGWFDTRAIFDDDEYCLDTFRLNVFVWRPIASGNKVLAYVTCLINAIMFC